MQKKYIGWMAIVIVLVVGFFFGDVKIQLGTYSPQASTKSIVKQIGNIQNITGIFFRSPGESLDRELANFSATEQKLDLWTYEFTQKDFKSALKKLAENNVDIRIIVENNKYQQYQNTLKELTIYFS
jgi:hypothetical protein